VLRSVNTIPDFECNKTGPVSEYEYEYEHEHEHEHEHGYGYGYEHEYGYGYGYDNGEKNGSKS
jgi:hydrogenase nickel incorporation protein HypB